MQVLMVLKKFLTVKNNNNNNDNMENQVYEKNLSPDFYKDPVKNDKLIKQQKGPEDKYKEPEYEPIEKAKLKKTGHTGDVPGNMDEF